MVINMTEIKSLYNDISYEVSNEITTCGDSPCEICPNRCEFGHAIMASRLGGEA